MWITNLYNGLAFLLSGPLNCELCIPKNKKKNKVTNLETGGSPWAISSAHFPFTDMAQVSSSLVSHRLLFYQDSQVLFRQTILSLAQWITRVGIGHTCGYLNAERIQHSFVPSCVTADAYTLIGVHLLRCSIWFELLLDQHFHSLLTCDILVAGEHTGEAGQATGDQ